MNRGKDTWVEMSCGLDTWVEMSREKNAWVESSCGQDTWLRAHGAFHRAIETSVVDHVLVLRKYSLECNINAGVLRECLCGTSVAVCCWPSCSATGEHFSELKRSKKCPWHCVQTVTFFCLCIVLSFVSVAHSSASLPFIPKLMKFLTLIMF